MPNSPLVNVVGKPQKRPFGAIFVFTPAFHPCASQLYHSIAMLIMTLVWACPINGLLTLSARFTRSSVSRNKLEDCLRSTRILSQPGRLLHRCLPNPQSAHCRCCWQRERRQSAGETAIKKEQGSTQPSPDPFTLSHLELGSCLSPSTSRRKIFPFSSVLNVSSIYSTISTFPR